MPLPAQMRILSLALMLGLVPSAWAESPTVLIWETCVQEATANNPDIRSARANLEAASFNAKGA